MSSTCRQSTLRATTTDWFEARVCRGHHLELSKESNLQLTQHCSSIEHSHSRPSQKSAFAPLPAFSLLFVWKQALKDSKCVASRLLYCWQQQQCMPAASCNFKQQTVCCVWFGMAAAVINVVCLSISLAMFFSAVQSAACNKDLTACK